MQPKGAVVKADSTLRSSRAVPHPSANRALRRLRNFGGQKRSGVFDAVWPSANVMVIRRIISRVLATSLLQTLFLHALQSCQRTLNPPCPPTILTCSVAWHGGAGGGGMEQTLNLKKIVYTSRFVRVILAQGPC